MSKRMILLASVGLIALALVVVGCHTVPLGDPEKSVVDPALAGWWISDKADKAGWLAYISPYDSRTYLITTYAYKGEGDAVKRDFKLTNKAWMTTVGGMDVMCLKVIDPEWDLQGGADVDARYSYFRIRKPAPGVMEATPLNIDFLKDTKTPDELARKIADNVNNPELWKGGDPLTLRLVPPEKNEDVKKIVKLWEPKEE
jgi:hypothetical protein